MTETTKPTLIAIENPRRELAHRATDGIEVTLYWDSAAFAPVAS